jgi:hypothetical protein
MKPMMPVIMIQERTEILRQVTIGTLTGGSASRFIGAATDPMHLSWSQFAKLPFDSEPSKTSLRADVGDLSGCAPQSAARMQVSYTCPQRIEQVSANPLSTYSFG